MKKIGVLFSLFIFLSATVWGAEYYYGFCDKDLGRTYIQSLGAGKANSNFFCMIHLSEEDATLLAGNKITGLYFSLGYCSATSVDVVISETPEGDALYSETCAVKMLSWNSATLTTPYTIEAGKDLYIGYEVAQKYSFDAPVDVVKDDTFGNTEGDFIGQGSSRASATWSHSSENGYGNLCLLALIEGENLPHRNVALSSAGLARGKGYVKTSTPFSIQGNLKNLGLDDVTSFTALCSIDDGEDVTKDFSCAVAHNDTANFVMDGFSVDGDGAHTATLTITKINGEEDPSMGDNKLSFSFQSYNDCVNRKTLVEFFTSQSCLNCDAGHAAVTQAIDGNPNAILVAHHTGFADDDFTTDWDAKYLWFFSSSGSGTYNPAVMFDRTNINEVTLQTDDAPVVFPYNNRCKDYLAYAQQKPSFVSININKVEFDPATGQLAYDADAELGAGHEYADSVSFTFWVVEDSLIGYQKLADGSIDKKFVHNGVPRFEAIDVMKVSELQKVAEGGRRWQIQGYYKVENLVKPENCRFVMAVSNQDATSNNKCQVLNAEQCGLTIVDGIEEVKSEKLKVKNPSYSISGQRVGAGFKGIVIENGKKKIKK